jgi:hypothetical protein
MYCQDLRARTHWNQVNLARMQDQIIADMQLNPTHPTDFWFGAEVVWLLLSPDNPLFPNDPCLWTRHSLQTTRRCGFVPVVPTRWSSGRRPITSVIDAMHQRNCIMLRSLQNVYLILNCYELTTTTWDEVCDDCRCFVPHDPRRRPLDRLLPGREACLPQPFVCEGCRFILHHTRMVRYCTTSHRCYCSQPWQDERRSIFRHTSQSTGRFSYSNTLLATQRGEARRLQALHCVNADMCMWFYHVTAILECWLGCIPPVIQPLWYALGDCSVRTPSRTTDAIITHHRARVLHMVDRHGNVEVDCLGMVHLMSLMTRGTEYWEQYTRRRKAVMHELMKRMPFALAEKIFDMLCEMCVATQSFP